MTATRKPTESTFTFSHGVLRIATGKRTDVYLVRQFETDGSGVGLNFRKACIGTDPEEEAYDVFVGSNQQDRSCSCKGFQRWGHQTGPCKHLRHAILLLEGGLIGSPVNEESDTATTEPNDQLPPF